MNTFDDKVLRDSIAEADYVLVGIGEEWSVSFDRMLEEKDFQKKYFELKTDEQKENFVPFLQRRYLSDFRNIELEKAYSSLLALLKDKDYFVVSMNKDRYPELAGLEKERMVFPCGGYVKLQCDQGCEDSLCDAESISRTVYEALENNSDMSETLYPVCSRCGERMVFNNIEAAKYMEQGYLVQWDKYMKWLQKTMNRKLCMIELGVSMKYPSVIRWPFEKTAFYNQKSQLFRLNKTLPQCTENIAERSYSLKKDSVDFFANLFV